MELEHVLYDVDGPVATITLNRPDRLNALTGQTMEEIGEALERAHVDGAIKVIVLTGAGRGFCSGGDRKATHARRGQGDDPADRPRMKRPFYKAQLLFTTLEKPVLAAINGPAMGGGLDLALWCDIRIASDRATMGEVYINRGLVPDMGGIYLLPRIVGYAKAAELLLTGDVLDAPAAKEIGLVNHVVPHDELMRFTYDMARKIAEKPGNGVAMTKRALAREMAPDWERASDYHHALQTSLLKSADFREADAAFVEKREAKFTGR